MMIGFDHLLTTCLQSMSHRSMLLKVCCTLIPASHSLLVTRTFIIGQNNATFPHCMLPVLKSNLGKRIITSTCLNVKEPARIAKGSIMLYRVFYPWKPCVPCRIEWSWTTTTKWPYWKFQSWLNRGLMTPRRNIWRTCPCTDLRSHPLEIVVVLTLFITTVVGIIDWLPPLCPCCVSRSLSEDSEPSESRSVFDSSNSVLESSDQAE